jgi:hypothetical protein
VLGKVTLGTSIIDQIPFLPNAPGLAGTGFETTPFYNNDLIVIARARRIPVIPGDYNFSGSVTAADYAIWRNNLGSATNAAADGNANGVVDTGDYVIYRKNFGRSAGSGAGDLAEFNVPEPSGCLLVFSALLTCSSLPRRRRVCGLK